MKGSQSPEIIILENDFLRCMTLSLFYPMSTIDSMKWSSLLLLCFHNPCFLLLCIGFMFPV